MTTPTVVVTGASSGTGAAAARRLRSRGVRVILVGRDPHRTARIGTELGAPAITADYADLSSVRLAAEQIVRHSPVIDVLVSNAGGAIGAPAPTGDGNEANYQVNALAPVLLETLLLPALRRARVPRLVSTSSRSHRAATLTPGRVTAQLDDPAGLGAHARYARAKLAGLLLHAGMRRRVPELVIVDVHPGLVATDFGRYLGRTGAVLKVLARPVLSSPETAAAHLLRPALHPGHDAAYYHRDRPRDPSPLVADPELQRQVWADARTRIEELLP
ncbi:SDR family NAD(P)-dependent oxidoreductase [Catenuloplanes atrovinosus]|uniref:NAD(P)-dependent dehydrogenase (Short-subunit alcohol dehydrogenase family) n=1 Tax=Catenuloplanes atrovinosus TaxID=137266 RepID=A0AAE3YPE6_9ACTN|nr:SDR family NAD(P)-dependent oxidoreductase [Catenuloplanes atrovinosus]MDR7277235.1 NAD(P)-dependent dehydrogenase (short-subunit alcohol dehydrogenase family) [Catenuloplanes atrovinosus]